jgi:hypothetical protein
MSHMVEDAMDHLRTCINNEIAARTAYDERDRTITGYYSPELKAMKDAINAAAERREDAEAELAEAHRIAATGMNVHRVVAGGAL